MVDLWASGANYMIKMTTVSAKTLWFVPITAGGGQLLRFKKDSDVHNIVKSFEKSGFSSQSKKSGGKKTRGP